MADRNILLAKHGNYLLIKADYKQKEILLEHMKGVGWYPRLQAWFVPATVSTFRNLVAYSPETLKRDDLPDNVKAWIRSVARLAKRLGDLQSDKVDNISFPEGFIIPVEPYRHQKQAIAFCINLNKSALWLDLGLGKTYTSITIARLRNFRKEVRKVLVLCPLSLIDQWKAEILKFSPKGSAVVHTVNSPNGNARAAAVTEFSNIPRAKPDMNNTVMHYCIMTYESVKKFSPYLEGRFDMFILDESTKVKGPNAARTIATSNLCQQVPYGLELTGLAFLNNPLDLFSQFEILDHTVYGGNIKKFSDHYVDSYKIAGSYHKGVAGFKNFDELKARAYYLAFSRNKSDCLDLPPQVYQQRVLPIYEEQAKYYNDIAGDLESICVNGSCIELNGVLVKLAKIQQLLAGFMIDSEGTPQWIGSPKYQEMVDIISSSGESFVVWAFHRCVLKKIKEKLTDANIRSVILSEENLQNQEKYKAQFRKGELKVIICQIQSESKGINLVSSKPVSTIYVESSLSVDDRHQSEGRTHRIGMTGTATYIDLLSKDTLDEQLYYMMRNNISVSKYIGEYGMNMLLGKGGTVTKQKIRMKKLKSKEDVVDLDELRSLGESGIEGLDGFI